MTKRQQQNKCREMKRDLIAAYCDRRGALPHTIKKYAGGEKYSPQVAGLLTRLFGLLPE